MNVPSNGLSGCNERKARGAVGSRSDKAKENKFMANLQKKRAQMHREIS